MILCQYPPLPRRSVRSRTREAARPGIPTPFPCWRAATGWPGWLGHGATACVWRARDELLDRDVAVKQFHTWHRHDVVEARIAARVRHPNVVAVHDVVQHGGSWLVGDETTTAARRWRR